MFNLFKVKAQQPKSLGQLGEELAQEEYKKRGYKIIAANFFNKKGLRLGEIDFIASDKKKIIFVEVKTRNVLSDKFGGGAEAVNGFKQIKILKAVKIYLQKNPKYLNLQPQIDVCLINIDQFDKKAYSAIIIPNAVEDWG
jgi:putative endonuclease